MARTVTADFELTQAEHDTLCSCGEEMREVIMSSPVYGTVEGLYCDVCDLFYLPRELRLLDATARQAS